MKRNCNACKKEECEDCREECTPRSSDCNKRKNNLKGEICPRKIITYEIDSCLISYKPRLITVPSERYKTLDDVLCKLEPYKGGYVILLKEGIHCISANICESVDNLHFIGDCMDHLGRVFVNGCRNEPVPVHSVCLNVRYAKNGEFEVTAQGRKITVSTIDGDNGPDFSNVCPGRRVGIIRCDGTILETEVESVCGNTIFIKDEPGFSSPLALGEGFFFCPNVILKSNNVDLKIFTTGQLIYEGLEIQIPFPFATGTRGLYMDIRRCLIYNIHITGIYKITSPNIYLGLAILTSGSNGNAYLQHFVGREARLVANTNASSSWELSTFVSTINGAKLINGAIVNFFGSDFINNCLGLQTHAGSNANIQGCCFISNKFALNAFYNSVVSSYHIDGDPEEPFRPIFTNNFVAINVGYGSYAVIPNSIIINNTHAFILDASIRSNIETNPASSYGTYYSIIINIFNPLAPDKLTNIACNESLDCAYFLTGTSTGVVSVHGNSTPSTISSICKSGNTNSGNVGPSGVGSLTGTAGSVYGTVCNSNILPPVNGSNNLSNNLINPLLVNNTVLTSNLNNNIVTNPNLNNNIVTNPNLNNNTVLGNNYQMSNSIVNGFVGSVPINTPRVNFTQGTLPDPRIQTAVNPLTMLGNPGNSCGLCKR